MAASCAVQRAYRSLIENGMTEQVARLTELLNDREISTRQAATLARTELGLHLANHQFTAHRAGVCQACNKARKQDIVSGEAAKPQGDEAVVYVPGKRTKKDRKNNPYPAPSGSAKPRMVQEEDGSVTVKDVPLYEPLQITDDLSPLLIRFGLDPQNFEVIKDQFSMWMQSASNGDDRDVVYMYAAKFRKIGRVDPEISNTEQIEKWRDIFFKGEKPKKPRYRKNAGIVGTYALWPSDLQLGKPGTQQAIDNFRNGISEGLEEAARLMDSGTPIEGLHIGWGGDETEGVANNYANQSYLIEMNQSEQLETDLMLRLWALREAQQLGLPISASSVVSNHGEWTRNGGKDTVTSKHDNASTHNARVIRLMAKHFGDNYINWTIGGDEGHKDPGLVLNLSGELVYSSHGHIEKGKGRSSELRTKQAIENQLLGDILDERKLLDVRLYVMAHYHHHYTLEDRGRVVMGLPALEAERSSEYMRQQYGVWSPPGLVGMVVGKYDGRPYRHLNIFGSTPARPIESD